MFSRSIILSYGLSRDLSRSLRADASVEFSPQQFSIGTIIARSDQRPIRRQTALNVFSVGRVVRKPTLLLLPTVREISIKMPSEGGHRREFALPNRLGRELFWWEIDPRFFAGC